MRKFFKFLFLSFVCANPCLVNDASDNVYIFTDAGDYKILDNAIDSQNPIPLQSNRSLKGMKSIKCFFEQYSNSGFFIDQNSLFSLNFQTLSWQKLDMITNGIVIQDANIVLDHNTVTFYGLYNGLMYYCPINVNNTSIEWKILKKSEIGQDLESEIVIGFGQNHLHFINLKDLKPGQAKIFVIHYAFWQPNAQTYTDASNGMNFPQIDGKTVSIPVVDNSVPIKFAFIPNDFSGTFIVDTRVEGTNTSIRYSSPYKDVNSLYVATTKEIIQVTSGFELYRLDITRNSGDWIKVDSKLSGFLQSNAVYNSTTVDGSNGTETRKSNFANSLSLEMVFWGFCLIIILL